MKLQVIIGSTREGRVSDRLAKWIAAEAAKLEGAEAELIDLAEYDLPFLNEPISPQYNPDRKPLPEAARLLGKFSEADAFILVSPEYNRSYSAALKNALDYIDFQFEKKPVGLVSHGVTGGAQAVAHLRGVLPGLLAVTVPRAVFFVGQVGEAFDESGAVKTGANVPQASVDSMLEDLKWYSDALASARVKKS